MKLARHFLVGADIHLLAFSKSVPHIYPAVSLLWNQMNGKRQCFLFCYIDNIDDIGNINLLYL